MKSSPKACAVEPLPSLGEFFDAWKHFTQPHPVFSLNATTNKDETVVNLSINRTEWMHIFVAFISLIILRFLIVHIAELTAGKLGVKAIRVKSFSNNAWRSSIQLFFTMLCWRMMNENGCSWLHHPSIVIEGYDHTVPLNTLSYFMHIVQMGYYIFEISWFLAFGDKKNSWWPVMIFHHLLTPYLINQGFKMGFYRGGVMIIFFHAITELVNSLNRLVYVNEPSFRGFWSRLINSVLPMIFISSWIYYRLYLFPLTTIYQALRGPTKDGIQVMIQKNPTATLIYYRALISLLSVIFVMDAFWSYFIATYAYKVIKYGKFSDTMRKHQKPKSKSVANGKID